MNTEITFPPAAPELKLPRASSQKWAATLTEERGRLQEDQEALREGQLNLRECEGRLRLCQAEIDAGRQGAAARVGPSAKPSQAPAAGDAAALQAGWEKLHRACELLAAEQIHMRDERITLRAQEIALKKRHEALNEREARLAPREKLAAAAPREPMASGRTLSVMTRLTRVFGGQK
ncbi:MAG: hypothetical protein RIQ93_239 [Verrucomicrobiota bacterium]|jgi:hypothetical protein